MGCFCMPMYKKTKDTRTNRVVVVLWNYFLEIFRFCVPCSDNITKNDHS